MSGHCFPRTGNFGPHTPGVRTYFGYSYIWWNPGRGSDVDPTCPVGERRYCHADYVDPGDFLEDMTRWARARPEPLPGGVVFSSMRVGR